MTHIVAVGGSDAGIAAALRIREIDPSVEVTVVLADEYPNYSICGIPYWISGDVAGIGDLAHRSRHDLVDAGITLRTSTTATDVDVSSRRLSLRGTSGAEDSLVYDELIVATGAGPATPAHVDFTLPGVHPLHTMGDAKRVMETVESTQPASAAIVGAGYIGLEMVEALTSRGIDVTLVQRGATVLPTLDTHLGSLLHDEMARRGVDVRTNVSVEDVDAAPSGGYQLLGHADTGSFHAAADIVLFATGVRPNVDLAVKAGARQGTRGAIIVDEQMRTGIPHVWAAGDCVITHHRQLGDTWLPLGTTAHKQGRIAGENAIGGQRTFAGSVGTQVVKVFDLVAARTGLRDQEATGLAHVSSRTHVTVADDHKAYYPGSVPLTVAVTGDNSSGRLLGAQIVGHRSAEISKRIDTFATALYADLTVDQVSELDLSYTPPLGSPWDAVQVAAQGWTRGGQEHRTGGDR